MTTFIRFRSFSFVFVRFRSFSFVFVRFRSFSFDFVRFGLFWFVRSFVRSFVHSISFVTGGNVLLRNFLRCVLYRWLYL